MKANLKKSIKTIAHDRYILVPFILLWLIALILAIYVLAVVRPSDLQLVSHYSAFGITHLYTDQWYYLYSFLFFAIICAGAHSMMSSKVLTLGNRSSAIALLWLGIAILAVALITTSAIFNVWNPL
jgi:hypothetical protein